jgi:membrane peptidoglycan carboxypeptidase
MVKKRWLSADDRVAAKYPTDLQPIGNSSYLSGPNGYLLSAVQTELEAQGISENEFNRGGLRIVTTFDPAAQTAALAAVAKIVGNGKVPADVHTAVVAVEPGTGKVLAMYGGADYITRPFNDVTQASLPMGSTFKAYVLAAALKSGISLQTKFSGHSPQKIAGTTFHNDNGESFGTINLLTATAQSVNTVFVQLGVKVGISKVIDAAHAAGLPNSTKLSGNASMLLGSDSAHPIDEAAAYATFAAKGLYAQPYVVQSVTDASGHLLYQAKSQTKQTFSDKVSADLTYALQQVLKSGTGKSAAIGRPAAGKTGTTDNNVSAWFVGYTPQLAAAVTMFRDNNAPLVNIGGQTQVYGGTLPAEIWAAFMKAALAHAKVVNFPPPANIGVAASPSPSSSAPVTPSPTLATAPPASSAPPPAGSPPASATSSPAPPSSPDAGQTPPPGSPGAAGPGP